MISDWLNFFKLMTYFSTINLSLTTLPNIISIIFILSNLNSVQFAIAHEIMHKPGNLHKYIGTCYII